MYPDAGGTRATGVDMAAQLADLGYAVLVPDVYYRSGDWAPFDMETVFSDKSERQRLFSMIGSVTPPDAMASDARAFFDYLAARPPEVTGETFGTTGYCMGGRTSLTVAGRVPERVAAAMSFHGGGLATDDPGGSPHLLADQITAAVYVGGGPGRRLVHQGPGQNARRRSDGGRRRAHHRVVSGRAWIRGPRQRPLRRGRGETALGCDEGLLRGAPSPLSCGRGCDAGWPARE